MAARKKSIPTRGSSDRGRGRGSNGPNNGGGGGPKLVMFKNKITYAQTLELTRNFHKENVLSRGLISAMNGSIPRLLVLSLSRNELSGQSHRLFSAMLDRHRQFFSGRASFCGFRV
ncbi:unnamed protein product [Linum tenue]|uniref:Uncharacterized protein n=1 Tax=Linum tenue TaxID=586396 RepID=A0AAV0I617_9ROSI|nr:unnamed protein product [Linum tenue]